MGMMEKGTIGYENGRFFPDPFRKPVILFISLACIVMPHAGAGQTLFEEHKPPIAIDPGHGGNDAGATGPNGTQEKTVTLNLARMLAAQLNDRYRVVLTRNGDYALELSNRTAVANHAQAEIFISVHTGSSFIRSIDGSAVYFYQPFQGAALATEIHATESLQDNRPDVSWDRIQTKYRTSSEKLARQIQSRLTKVWQKAEIDVQGVPLIVLEGADMPAVAIEIGNLSNANAEKALGDPDFLSRVAEAVAGGINAFFSEKQK